MSQHMAFVTECHAIADFKAEFLVVLPSLDVVSM